MVGVVGLYTAVVGYEGRGCLSGSSGWVVAISTVVVGLSWCLG